ncbi:Cdc6/Cdc18 family protein [Halostagnicola kamekurae]|uniref:Cdc6-related protein, AAA superfamily ATPase n=1 Tax=Halostagnicola kamekurae TaxID=619731 RepID=A0A1I6RUZ3_9EURY|nr:AAA family ATPase [Halostagnicola kamekurae]SFS68521.1 Cdc6-related protein, AAA superfamily ATPase [Halostagnicola kamekurae]
MDLRDRIARRRSAHNGGRLVVDREYLSPAVHATEPVGRGSVLEQCLDALEPVFDGDLPPPTAVVGPPGSGTSAIVTTLFAALNQTFGDSGRAIGTSTRTGRAGPTTWFVYVDGRRVQTPFAFYRAALATISDDAVPTSGVGTDELRERVIDRLERPDRRAIVAIDHHDEPETLTYDRVLDLLEPVGDAVRTVAVGAREPDDWHDATITVPAYRQHELVDILADRASTGLAAGALAHDSIRRVAEWADGSAHDALAALYVAAIRASDDGADQIRAADLEAAIADVPKTGIHIDRTLALSQSRQQVLLDLLSVSDGSKPIREVARAIDAESEVTASTATRFLYELADIGVLERVGLESTGSGRRPSTVEPRFSPIAFRSLIAE